MDRDESRLFFWSGAVIGGLSLLMAMALAVRQIAFPKVIELGKDTLILPAGFAQMRTFRIPYAEIEQVSERSVRVADKTHTFLDVTAQGRKFVIIPDLFVNKESYAALKDRLRLLAMMQVVIVDDSHKGRPENHQL